MITQENTQILAQYINALNQAVEQLEQAYFSKDRQNFDRIKKFILEVQIEIGEVLR